MVDVEHVAELARLGNVRSPLAELDTAAIPPTAQVIAQTNVLRDDEVRPSLPIAAVLANAPRHADGFFEVDAVLGGNDEAAG